MYLLVTIEIIILSDFGEKLEKKKEKREKNHNFVVIGQKLLKFLQINLEIVCFELEKSSLQKKINIYSMAKKNKIKIYKKISKLLIH